MPRPQFSLKTLLWLIAVVAAVLAGTRFGERREQQKLQTQRDALEEERDDLRANQRLIENAMGWMESQAKKHGDQVPWGDLWEKGSQWMQAPARTSSKRLNPRPLATK